MSYDICKSVSIKNGTITLNVASNNVYPHTFEKWYYNEGCKLEDSKFFFFLDVLDGNIQFHQLNKSTLKYEHALIRVKKWFSEKVQSEYEYFKKSHSGISDNEVKELYKEPYRVWNEALAEKDTECVVRCNKYHVPNMGYIFIKPPKYGLYGITSISYTTSIREAVMSRKKAEIVLWDFEHGWEQQRAEGMELFIENC